MSPLEQAIKTLLRAGVASNPKTAFAWTVVAAQLASPATNLATSSGTIEEAIEHRDLAMALSAALIEHVRNFCADDGASLTKLDEFQRAAQQECNRLHQTVFKPKPFNQ
jgi:hypothetical protein